MLVNTIAEVQFHTLGDVGAEELVDLLAGTPADVEDQIVGQTMGDVDAEALIDTMADTIKIVKSETPLKRLGAKALVDTLGYKGHHATKGSEEDT